MEVLDLSETDVDDAALADLSRCVHLKILCLNNTRVTDAGLVHLGKLSRLESLYLNNTQVTFPRRWRGFTALRRGMKQLKEVSLQGTKLAEFAVEELQKSLPNCQITH